uniref:Aspartate aminotransferase n=1 Tax=Desmarestia viridis TaxID=62313 RepID=A0A097IUT5_9PHAE|nr:aspartate aminotransferase [Desmarestia viridis]
MARTLLLLSTLLRLSHLVMPVTGFVGMPTSSRCVSRSAAATVETAPRLTPFPGGAVGERTKEEAAVNPFDCDDTISPLVKSVAPSKTIEVHALTQEMKARGERVVSLCVGEPDFEPPPAVIEATARAAKEGKTKYTGVTGTLDIRRAICADLTRRKGVPYAAGDIVVANGAKQAVFEGVFAVVRPGDEVIIPAPYWPSYPELVKLAGGVPVIVETTVEEEFMLTAEKLRGALTDRTRMLIFCNPSNPTGAVHSKELCEELAAVLSEKGGKGEGVWVMADEIYERIVYDTPHVAFAGMPGMWERTMTVNGFSKSHAMTGYRIGYLAAPPVIVKAVTTLQGQLTSCASAISQAAGMAALEVSDEEMQASFDIMRAKRDFVMKRVAGIPGLTTAEPQGAFYVLPDVSSHFGKTAPDGTVIGGATDLCLYLLRAHSVALVTGEGFGYPKGIRISYAASMEDLAEALGEFDQCIRSLK